MEAAQFWNRVAERYARSPIADTDAYEATLARVRAHLKPTDRALELGCGTGTTALRLADAVDRYTASDFSNAMLEIGAQKAQAAHCGNLDFRAVELGSGQLESDGYDVVLAFNVLHLVPELPTALDQIRGAMRPGGRFISKTPCWPAHSVPLKYRALASLLPIMRLLGKAPDFVKLRSVRDLEAVVRDAGFELLEVGDYPNHPPSHLVVAQKSFAH